MVWNVQRSAPVLASYAAYVPRGRRQLFSHAPADDEGVPIDDSRRRQLNRLLLGIPAQIRAEVDASAFPEGGDRLPGLGVEGVEEMQHCREHPPVGAVRPVHQTAIRPSTLDSRIERPQELSRRGAKSKSLVRRRQRIKDAVDDDGLGLESPGLPGVVGPGDLQILHVPAVDLTQARITNLFGAAPVRLPSSIFGRGEEKENDEQHRNAMRVSKTTFGGIGFGVATLALGLAATGLVFGVVSGVLLRPFPFHDPERLVLVWDTNRDRPRDLEMTSYSNFVDYAALNEVFEGTAAWQRPTSMTLKSTEGAEEIHASVVTSSFFAVVGVEPVLGRGFLPEEGVPGGPGAVVLSDGLWLRRFGASAEVLGSTVVLDGAPYAVVGVAPPEFESPAGESEIFVPMAFAPNAIDRGQNYLSVIGRLRPEVALEAAQSEMDRLGSTLEREYPATNDGVRPRLVPLSDHVLGPVRPVILTLFGGVLFLLAVACANVSNLHLARIVSREGEIAIRLSLGASRLRVFASTLLEAMWVWAGGAGAALVAIRVGFPFLSSLLGDRLPRVLEGRPDGATLAFTVVAAAATALAFGAPVAFYASRVTLQRSRAGRGAETEDPAGRRLRRALVVAQSLSPACSSSGAGFSREACFD